MRLIRSIPFPIAGLALALAALGNLIGSYGAGYRSILGSVSAVIVILVTIKLFAEFGTFKAEMKNPVTASVFPAYYMAIMLLMTYLKPVAPGAAKYIWLVAIALHIIHIIYFVVNFIFVAEQKNILPSWFITFVGLVTASVSSPAFEMTVLGQWIFRYGLIAYLLLLLPVLKRVFITKGVPEPALPLLTVVAAPAALCLAGYMSAFSEKSLVLAIALLIVSQLSYFYGVYNFLKLLRLKFYPSFSGFTFPLVISAISLKLTFGYIKGLDIGFGWLVNIVKGEELVAVIVVLYVLVRYLTCIYRGMNSKDIRN